MLFAKALPATSEDWFVKIESQPGSNLVLLTFYPILQFRCRSGECLPITTCPEETLSLAKQSKPSDGPGANDHAYGTWFRDGLRFDRFGRPSWSAPHFNNMLASYKAVGRVVRATNAPDKYQHWVVQAFPSKFDASD